MSATTPRASTGKASKSATAATPPSKSRQPARAATAKPGKVAAKAPPGKVAARAPSGKVAAKAPSGKVAAKAPRAAAGDRALWVGARAHYDDAADYDKTYGRRREDVAYYEALVAGSAGPVLEYGVGNGRIALPLARSGAVVTGVDWSAPMLDDLRTKIAREPAEVQRRLRLVEGDMREVRLG